VRFEQRLRDGIHSGAIVLAFRRWKHSQVVPGHRYRTGTDMVENAPNAGHGRGDQTTSGSGQHPDDDKAIAAN